MKVYCVSIKTKAYILADSHEDAAQEFVSIAQEASASLPGRVACFDVHPYLLPNQAEWIRRWCISLIVTGLKINNICREWAKVPLSGARGEHPNFIALDLHADSRGLNQDKARAKRQRPQPFGSGLC
jgi:hypothetical protein